MCSLPQRREKNKTFWHFHGYKETGNKRQSRSTSDIRCNQIRKCLWRQSLFNMIRRIDSKQYNGLIICQAVYNSFNLNHDYGELYHKCIVLKRSLEVDCTAQYTVKNGGKALTIKSFNSFWCKHCSIVGVFSLTEIEVSLLSFRDSRKWLLLRILISCNLLKLIFCV